MSWRNVESDTTRVRDKTLSRSRYRCVVCGCSLGPVFTPSGAKVYLSRCDKHEKETHGRRDDDSTSR